MAEQASTHVDVVVGRFGSELGVVLKTVLAQQTKLGAQAGAVACPTDSMQTLVRTVFVLAKPLYNIHVFGARLILATCPLAGELPRQKSARPILVAPRCPSAPLAAV